MKPAIHKPLVKVCGLRRIEDAELCVQLGAKYLGLVMAKDSPRCASVQAARQIACLADGTARVVLVFRGNSVDEILRLCEQTSVRRVQIHGTNPQACMQLGFCGLTVHPVYQVDANASRLPEMPPASEEQPAMLDAGCGGSGQRFAWDLLGDQAPPGTFVAGGVTPDNVRRLLTHQPFGIDISSGVETAPGIKDPEKLQRLFAEVTG